MSFSVYIAKPPAGGGYGPLIHKVGKTTEGDVQSRVAALNDTGSNYPTDNGENWELVDHFTFANQPQMDAFEGAMAANLGAGLDPRGTGATELFESAAIDDDIREAALAAVKTLFENDLVDVGAIAGLAAKNGMAVPQLPSSTDDLPEEVVEEAVGWFLNLLAAGVPVVGIGLAVWRGKRIYRWIRGEWEQALKRARLKAPPRPPEPMEVTEARRDLERARKATEFRQQSK